MRCCWRAGVLIAALLLAGCDLPDPVPRWRDVADELGFAYRIELDRTLREELGRLPSVAARPMNFFPEVLRKDDAVIADWVWRDGRLKDRDRVAQTIFAFRVRGADEAVFVLSRRGELDREELRRLGGLLDWPAASEFSDAFDVAGPDRAAVRRWLQPSRRAAISLPEGWRVEGAGRWLVVYAPGVRVPPTRLAERFEQARRIIEPLSPGVRAQY